MATKNFNLKDEAAKLPFAAVGALDVVVERVRVVSTDVQARINDVDFDFDADKLVEQARGVVKTRVEEVRGTAETRRKDIEKRVAELQKQAEAFPTTARTEAEKRFNDGVAVYGDLAARGEKLVEKIRGGEATQEAIASAKQTVTDAKAAAKATTEQAKGGAKTTASTAKNTKGATSKAKTTAKTAKSSSTKAASTAKSGAKKTTASAKKTASKSTKAAGKASDKVGA